jgi:hypothetical protein
MPAGWLIRRSIRAIDSIVIVFWLVMSVASCRPLSVYAPPTWSSTPCGGGFGAGSLNLGRSKPIGFCLGSGYVHRQKWIYQSRRRISGNLTFDDLPFHTLQQPKSISHHRYCRGTFRNVQEHSGTTVAMKRVHVISAQLFLPLQE